jgi:acetyl esterase/lipase
MSILSVPFVADTVARLFGKLSALAPRVRRQFPEIDGDTYTLSVPTRHGGVECTIYRPPSDADEKPPVYVNAHGGGFVIGYSWQDDPWCRYLAAHAKVAVVNVDYATAPRSRFPAAIEQLFDVLRWASSAERDWDGLRLCVGGQSAGGALAAGAARLALENGGPKIALQVLHYPPLDLVTPPRQKHAAGGRPFLRPWMGEIFDTAYIPNPDLRLDRLASPAWGSNGDGIKGIAPALVITAERDRLRDEAAVYAGKLDAAESLVEYRDVPGVDHGYNLVGGSEEITRRMYDFIIDHVARAVRT